LCIHVCSYPGNCDLFHSFWR